MRKLVLQTQVSIDGFMAGPNHEMDWMAWDWDQELNAYVTELAANVDCIVLGRTFAAGFIPHWEGVANDANNPEQAFGARILEMDKVVFSTNPSAEIDTSAWPNTRASGKALQDGIRELKAAAGGDIIAYGGSAFVSSLIKQDLVDELNLFVNPTALGTGMPLFHQLETKRAYKLRNATAFTCGIAALQYLKA